MPLTCLMIVLAEFADLAREVTASIMSSVVFPGAISESRNPCSSVGESVNSSASSRTDPLSGPSKVLLVPSFEWELGREKRGDSPKRCKWWNFVRKAVGPVTRRQLRWPERPGVHVEDSLRRRTRWPF